MNNERKITREYPMVDKNALPEKPYWPERKITREYPLVASESIESISCQTRESTSKTNPGFTAVNPFEQPYREQMDTLRDEPDHMDAQPEIEVGEESLPDDFLDEDENENERQTLPRMQSYAPAKEIDTSAENMNEEVQAVLGLTRETKKRTANTFCLPCEGLDISHLAADRDRTPPPVKVGKPVEDTTYRAVLGSASSKANSYFEKAIETVVGYRMSNPRTTKRK